MSNDIDISKVQWDSAAPIDPSKVQWDQPATPPRKKSSTPIADYFMTPPDRPESLKDFVTKNVPRSAANTLYGIASALPITAPFVQAHDMATGGPRTQSALSDMKNLKLSDVPGKILENAKGLAKSIAAPFGLADSGKFITNAAKGGPFYAAYRAATQPGETPLGETGGEEFTDAWTRQPVQSALAAAPVVKPLAAAVRHPLQLALQIPSKSSASRLYESAMKFSNNPNVLSPANRRAAIQTGLEDGYAPTHSDYSRLWREVAKNKGDVNRIVDAGAKQGDVIDTARALRPLDNVRKRFDLIRDQHPEIAEAVDDVYARYSQQAKIPVKEAQALKETLQDLASYADDGRSKATNRAYKAVARGIRIELESLYPDLAKLNKKSSALLNLENELAKATGRIGNRDITSLGIRVALSGQPSGVGAANTLLSILEMPRVKARMAIAIYKAHTGKTLPLMQWRKALAYPSVSAAIRGSQSEESQK